MFNRLQKKWKVNGWRLAIILLVFAIGGSLTGYAGEKMLDLFAIERSWLWVVIYIVIICLLWPLAVLLISIPFGQYQFFIKYIKKIGRRVGVTSKPSKEGLKNVAVFASGAG